jgi:site-specific DNA-methyltransferase (adenine-specific)/adenine-specific DNA-methyltransferase
MPRRHDTERYDLSDAEKRDLIALIQAGKPLPERYRFILFADKREVELVWNGETREVYLGRALLNSGQATPQQRRSTRSGTMHLSGSAARGPRWLGD